ncbi:MAG: hypothetical protein HPY85_16220 [Anaerolineae bacterium]|nr:hypothetical protein [Anaerolineae bacterium]
MRPFNLHDLPALHAYRDQVISLDCAYDLTRGSGFLAPGVLLDHLVPERESVLAVAYSDRYQQKLLGRMAFHSEERSASLSFLMPQPLSGTIIMGDLVNDFCRQAGEWGAVSVRAEVEVGDPVFSTLRRCGFQVYDRQRVWQVPAHVSLHHLALRHHGWEHVMDMDQIAVRHLFYSLVPPLVQAAQPLLPETLDGLVYWQDGEVLGYLQMVSGPNGVFLKPLLHPALEHPAAVLQAALVYTIPLLGRPVYVAVPSYQSWIEPTLYEMKAEAASLRTMMVRYLAQPLRVMETETALRKLEHVRMRPTHFSPPGRK